jgi:putative ABC transport system substrate-binding protein
MRKLPTSSMRPSRLQLSSPAFTPYRSQIAELAIEQRLPSMFTFKHYTEAGGLMSYGFRFPTTYMRIRHAP